MKRSDLKKFLHDGWVILDIPRPNIIDEYVSFIQQQAQKHAGKTFRLADLHTHFDDEAFKKMHNFVSENFWKSEFSLRISRDFSPMLKDLIGLDVMVQYMPYLRFARPHRFEDNIGYHRDTQYGQTPYELAAHVPFVDLDERSALRVISGSHRQPESAFLVTESTESAVEKGSVEHRLGKPYSTKRMSVPDGLKIDSLAMRVGQVAFFSPALFHGQEVNSGNITRVSSDIRFVSPYADAKIRVGKVHAGYVPVSSSPVQQLAREYYEAQKLSK